MRRLGLPGYRRALQRLMDICEWIASRVSISFLYGQALVVQTFKRVSEAVVQSIGDNVVIDDKSDTPTIKAGKRFTQFAWTISVTGLVLFVSACVLLIQKPATGSSRSQQWVFLILSAIAFALLPLWASSMVSTLRELFSVLVTSVNNRQEFKEEYRQRVAMLLSPWGLIIITLIIVSLGWLTLGHQPIQLIGIERFLFTAIAVFLMAACGLGFYIGFTYILFFLLFPGLRVRVFINPGANVVVDALRSTIFRVGIWYAFYTVLIEIDVFVSVVPYTEIIAWALVGSGTGILLVTSQLRTHGQMRREKDDLRRTFSANVGPAFLAAQSDPTVRNMTQYLRVQEMQALLDGLPEWPFDLKSIAPALGSFAISVVAGIAANALVGTSPHVLP